MKTRVQSARIIFVGFIAMAAVVAGLRHGLPVDDRLSDLFFTPGAHGAVDGHWLWPKSNHFLSLLLHETVRYGFAAFAALCLVVALAAQIYPRLKKYQYACAMIFLALTLNTLAVGYLKNFTHTFCPSQTERYGGAISDDYKTNPAHRPATDGKCYPAAHAVPGFSMMILGVIAVSRRRKIAGYAAGVIMGLGLSVIQMGRGEHFLSHCLATAALALWVVQALPFMAACARDIRLPSVGPRVLKTARIAGGAVALIALLLGGYLVTLPKTGNFHAVIARELYRAAQPSPRDIVLYARLYGIKTMVNLRGAHPGDAWYDAEAAAARREGVTLVDFGMGDREVLTPVRARALIGILQTAQKPILLHCNSGENRTSLAAALYVAAVARLGEGAAEAQMSMWYGYIDLPFVPTYAMDRSFEAIEPLMGFLKS